MFVKNLNQLSKDDVVIAGGKGASLGEMIKAGIPVPAGFVILSHSFEKFLEEAGLNIDSILSSINSSDMYGAENTSEKIKSLILKEEIPKEITEEINKYFKNLDEKYVAVRSSATVEDSVSSSWAGQLDSYLNTTEENLFENIKKCWASLFTPRAILYRFEKGLSKRKISVAVVVQKMIESEKSGVAFSVHPVTQDKNQLIIEAGFGLGEGIVSGQITPDSYVVKKQSLKIINKDLQIQTKGLYRLEKGGNEWRDISKEKVGKQVLSDKEILELSKTIISIENHYDYPVDVEWAFENNKIFITQSRPITTLNKSTIINANNEYELTFSRECIMLTLQAWYLAENDKFSKHIGYQFPITGWMFFEYVNGLARNYIDMSLIKNAYEFALSQTLKDKKYFESIEKSFWHYFYLVKPYLAGKMDINTREELKVFFDNAIEVWGAQTIFYAFTFFENANVSKEIFQRSEKIRLTIETIIDDCTRIFSKGLRNIFGKQYIDDYKYLTIEEIISDVIPPKNILQQRSKYIIYFDGIRHDDSLDSFLIKENKHIEKVEYSEGDALRGQIAHKGKVRGRAKICFTKREIGKIEVGDILVSSMTTADFLPAIKLASAMVTDEGGITCHAAIVARELKKPCVIGTKIATKMLKDGDLIEVDADNGFVKKLNFNQDP